MEQQFEGTPQAEIRWKAEAGAERRGERLGVAVLWEIRRNGQVVATVPARANTATNTPTRLPASTKSSCKCSSTKATPKTRGNFTKSKLVEVSNKVSYTSGDEGWKPSTSKPRSSDISRDAFIVTR